MLVLTVFLFILSVGLSISLFLLKREIKSIRNQLYAFTQGVEKPIDIVFIDKDLTALAANINKNQAFQKEQKLSLLKEEHHFKETISNISHDLRTPLTSIIGYLQLLQKTAATDEQKEYIHIALSRARYLQTLIGEFYEISILENKNNTPILEKINLGNILTEIILSFSEQLEEHHLTPYITSRHTPFYVLADETMLKRMLTNLVANAIRYGRGALRIELFEEDDIQITFQNEVEHNQNINAARLFEKFYAADSSRNSSGSGLGLYIVKVLSEKMGGSVSAKLDDHHLTIQLRLLKA